MTPVVHLYADPSKLVNTFVDALLQKGVKVEINPLPLAPEPNYIVVFISSKEKVQREALTKLESFKGKSLVVIPYFLPPTESVERVVRQSETNPKLKVIYLGETFPTSGEIGGPIATILATQKKSAPTPPLTATLYALDFEKGIPHLIRTLFSYGQERPVFLAQAVPVEDIVALRLKKNPKVKLSQTQKEVPPPNAAFQSIGSGLTWLEREYSSLTKQAPPLKKAAVKKREKIFIKRPRYKLKFSVKHKFALGALGGLLLLVALPFITLFSAASFLTYGASQVESGNFNRAKTALNVSSQLSGFSKDTFFVFQKTPFAGKVFASPYKASLLVNDANKMGERGLAVVNAAKELLNGVVGVKPYEVSGVAAKLSVEIGALYSDLSFFESEMKLLGRPFSNLFPDAKFAQYRKYLFAAKEFSASLPELLGDEKPTTYLVLFQNNMELRPAGGFIGSFALVTFENGKLTENVVYDVYSADGQLQGYVRPPEPIEEHLGEASWYMRDSNWDPNFPVSAQRAEWFLDKTLGRKVDGVVAIDLEVAKTILDATGPVTLPDFADTITSENLYVKVQSEVENEFFPGSRKKADYLTALAKSLIARVKELKEDQYIDLARGLVKNLAARDIQLALKQSRPAEAAQVLGWNGAVQIPSCEGNCEVVWLGVVEANVGVNKVNAYIQRDATLSLDVKNQSVSGTLTLNLSNTSAFGGDTYKNYLRVLLPKSATVTSVRTESPRQNSEVTPDVVNLEDRVEAGFLVEIEPQETKVVTLNWSNTSKVSLFDHGRLGVYIRKQSGVPEYPLKILFNVPKTVKVSPNPPFSLTAGSFIGYNTGLATDFEAILTW